MRPQHIEASAVAEVVAVLQSNVHDLVAAIAIRRAGLIEVELTIAVTLVPGGVGDELVVAERAATVTGEVVALIAVQAYVDVAARLVLERSRDDIDGAGNPLRAIEQTLCALQNFDPLDHVGREGVGAGVVEDAIVDTHAVDQPQHIACPRALQGHVDIVVGTTAGRDEQAWNLILQSRAHIDIAGGRDTVGRDRIDLMAVPGEFDRQGVIQ